MNRDRLIVALDVDSLKEAGRLVQILKKEVDLFKVGITLFTSAGPSVVQMIHGEGGRVFLDLKFHDIPNTVARACEAAASLNPFLLDVHASGGREMLQAAQSSLVNIASSTSLIGVTVLTSDSPGKGIDREVLRLATLCKEEGLAGVVCSPQEARSVREKFGKDFLIITPGIRSGMNEDDQKRSASAAQAVHFGADYIVVGRPIITSPDPIKAAQKILDEIASI